jgi:DNA-directed RNA polymerase subunit RPC12/RpoP
MWFARLIGIVPLGIGLTVLGFMWGAPFGEFGSPPLFFRIFASFIALGFVMFGGAMLFGSHLATPERMAGMARRLRDAQGQVPPPVEPSSSAGYRCVHCSAPLGEGADVSPSGDVKCTHCGKWFNIHRS